MALDSVTFHAMLGTQGQRGNRIRRLASDLSAYTMADPVQAGVAGRLCKADLLTGMVGEFPELQGVMGSYYAAHDKLDARVVEAIRDHYAPKGPGDDVPSASVAVAVALADKLDTLAGFFAIGEKPTGSGDPYALRRAGLGVIRLVTENRLRVPLRLMLTNAVRYQVVQRWDAVEEVMEFLVDVSSLKMTLNTVPARPLPAHPSSTAVSVIVASGPGWNSNATLIDISDPPPETNGPCAL